MVRTFGVAGAMAALLLSGAPAMAACEFTKIGEMAVDMSHRVLLISSQGRMYFKWNGGTVFAAPGAQAVVPGLIGSAVSGAAFSANEIARR